MIPRAPRTDRTPVPWRVIGRVIRRLAGRLPGSLAVVGLAVAAGFLSSHALPGDPVQMMVEGQPAAPELVRALREGAGLDRPLAVQFMHYALALVRGDLGMSLRYGGVPVATLVGEALPVTAALIAGAVALALPFGVLAGLATAENGRAWPGAALTVASTLVLSTPPLAAASWLLMTVSGSTVPALLVLALPAAAVIARITRTQVAEVLGHDFIRTATAKGVGRTALLLRHALPHALVPLAAVAGSVAGALLTATAAVESVFALPGLGQLAVQAVLARDHPLAGAAVLILVLGQIAVTLLAEVVIGLADPRPRTGPGTP